MEQILFAWTALYRTTTLRMWSVDGRNCNMDATISMSLTKNISRETAETYQIYGTSGFNMRI